MAAHQETTQDQIMAHISKNQMYKNYEKIQRRLVVFYCHS